MNAVSQMILEKVSPYPFDRTIDLLLEGAAKKEWQVPAVHDLQQSLAKAGKTVKPVKVIEMCKPEFSGEMLEKSDERIVSVMMPCRVSVYLKDDGKTYIALVNIATMAEAMPEMVRDVMTRAAREISELVDALTGKSELISL